MPGPPSFGVTRGWIYALDGRCVGHNLIRSEPRAGGNVYVSFEAWLRGDGADRLVNRRSAELAPVPGDAGRFRPLWQDESMATARAGETIELHVDHVSGALVCTRRSEVSHATTTSEDRLPPDEQVANVVMSLALQSLAAAAADRVRFQFAVCLDKPRIAEMEARPERRGDDPVEIAFHYQGWLALVAWLLPDFRTWMRSEAPYEWVGNRVPLHENGDTVTFLRDAWPTRAIVPSAREARAGGAPCAP